MSMVIANWKSYKTRPQAIEWLHQIATIETNQQIIVCPPFPLLPILEDQVKAAGLSIQIGAQDCSQFPFGAYTGEVAAETLASCGASYVIVGHSERRRLFGETAQTVAAQAAQVHQYQMRPIICVDESDISAQVAALESEVADVAIWAYEPLSAIGTGERVSLDVLKRVRKTLEQKLGSSSTFVYGGSVTEASVAEYLMVADGVLVGSASLDAISFMELIQAAN